MAHWKGHSASPSKDEVAPSPDFKSLNKMAIGQGLHSAKDLPAFRKEHSDVKLKTAHGEASPTRRSNMPTVPPKKAGSMFGMPSGYRTAEVVRSFGPEEPPVKHLIQGAYQDEWVRKNLEAEAAGANRARPYIPPAPTKVRSCEVLVHADHGCQVLGISTLLCFICVAPRSCTAG